MSYAWIVGCSGRRRMNPWLRALLSIGRAPVFFVDRDGVVVEADAAARAFACAPGERFDRAIIRMRSGAPFADEDHPLARALDGETCVSPVVIEVAGLGKPVRATLRTAPVLDESAIVGVAAVAELEDCEGERQRERLQTIGRLAAAIAHDFNNYLAIVLLYSEAMGDSLAPAHPLRFDVDAIVSATHRARALTRQLLTFARHAPDVPEALDVNAAIRELEPLAKRLLVPAGVDLTTDLAGGVATVFIDRGELERALLNLLTNARDAMPNGGRVVVRTRVDEETVRVEVEDTGTGIDDTMREQIFRPFYTTKPGGTGLGLATVASAAASARGRVDVRNADGKGAVFALVLPASAGEASASDGPRGASIPPRGRMEQVLVVEADASVRTIIVELLARAGYRAHGVASASEALLVAERAPVDLLITDRRPLHLPASELVACLRRRSPEMRVLYVCPRGEVDGAPSIEKPFTLHSLMTGVRAVLDAPA